MNLSILPVAAPVASRRLDFRLEPAASCHLPEKAEIYAEQIAAGLGCC